MEYKGIELEEVTEPQVFEKPEMMFVWDEDGAEPVINHVMAIIKDREYSVISKYSNWKHCARIPESKPVTYCELSQWLAKGNGKLRKCTAPFTIYTCLPFTMEEADEPVDVEYAVSKWKDTEWHKPTREYLGLVSKWKDTEWHKPTCEYLGLEG